MFLGVQGRVASFPGSSAPEQEIEFRHAERAWYIFSCENPSGEPGNEARGEPRNEARPHYLVPLFSSNLQFNLSVGIIGVIYFAVPVTYGIGTISVRPLTDRLVRLS